MKVSISLQSTHLYFRETSLENPHCVTIPAGIVAVVGANGSGKSTLGEIISHGWNFRTNSISCREKAHPVVKKIQFDDIHSLSGLKVEYYQQRYEACSNDDIPLVADLFPKLQSDEKWQQLSDLLRLGNVSERRINFLSSGELRKMLIINAIADSDVDLLILDNPYIGLDDKARKLLDEALKQLGSRQSIMLLVSDPKEIPTFAQAIVPMKQMRILPVIDGFEDATKVAPELQILFDYAIDLDSVPMPNGSTESDCLELVNLNDISISYGSRNVVKNFSWKISAGEHWALLGPNGSGKSTLLSLLTADNPRAYSMDISLFGRRRGSGESIWDIKRNVGYISPELALHFHPAGTVATIVAQGLNDTNGIFHPVSPAQESLATTWMKILHMEQLADRRWNTLSSGERQMVLLARVFIKQPRLMIFDEPFHGLDFARKKAVRALINYFAARAENLSERFPLSIIIVSHYDDEIPECVTYYKSMDRNL